MPSGLVAIFWSFGGNAAVAAVFHSENGENRTQRSK
jgi:hypothetical protein